MKNLTIPRRYRLALLALVPVLLLGAACTPQSDDPASLTIYSGRSQELIAPLIERFRRKTDLDVQVRYGGTAELAATILEEGANSPADLFFAQDAGALGALARENRQRILPDSILSTVDARYRSPQGLWVGTSGRARVVVYHTELVSPEELPDSVRGFTDPGWKGRLGWAPGNGSFQAFVTALRLVWGEEETRRWLEGMLANEPRVYPSNTSIVEATGRGEIHAGLTNHYYLFRFLREHGESFSARNYYPRAGGVENLVNVSGVAILDTCRNLAGAERFVEFLLSTEAQEYFAAETSEYPLRADVSLHPLLKPLDEIDAPELDLSELEDLEGTLRLLREVGAL